MAYVDYAYYVSDYLGDAIAEADFPRLAERASEYVDYITRGGAAEVAELPSVKAAVCALAELMEANPSDAGLASETVGGWSRSYRSRSELDARLYATASRYLAGTGLLYRGGRRPVT